MSLAPQISGTAAIRGSAREFIRAFRRRVAGGLLTGRRDRRSNYEAAPSGPDELRVRAADMWTAVNNLRFPAAGTVQYTVCYWRWASYVLSLSGLLGLVGVALLFTTDVRSYIARNPASRVPGLSVDQNLLILWAILLFWVFVWPWLLIALHKRPLRRLLERIIGEVDGDAVAAAKGPESTA